MSGEQDREGDDLTPSGAAAVRLALKTAELREWKAEAMVVLAEWERVWEALDRPGELGTSKAVSALAEVERLRGERCCDRMHLAASRANRAEAKVARVERVVLKWSCPPLENRGNTLVLRDLRDALRDDA